MTKYMFTDRELDRLRVKWIMYGYNQCLSNNSRSLGLDKMTIESKINELEGQANMIINDNEFRLEEIYNEN